MSHYELFGDMPPSVHRRRFSRLGLALALFLLLPILIQMALSALLSCLAPDLSLPSWASWASGVISQYLIAFPAAALVLVSLPPAPAAAEERSPLSPAQWLLALAVSLGVLFLTNLCTVGLIALIDALRGVESANPLELSLAGFPLPLQMISACLLAPVCEELFFRRLLLRRLEPYGPRFAALASALCFSLMHANLYQLLYAFALGLVFAWICLRTGRVWQTVLLHALINLLGGGFLSQLFSWDALAFTGLIYVAATAVSVAFLVFRRCRLTLDTGRSDLTEGQKWRLFLLSPGTLLFLLAALICAVLVYMIV